MFGKADAKLLEQAREEEFLRQFYSFLVRSGTSLAGGSADAQPQRGLLKASLTPDCVAILDKRKRLLEIQGSVGESPGRAFQTAQMVERLITLLVALTFVKVEAPPDSQGRRNRKSIFDMQEEEVEDRGAEEPGKALAAPPALLALAGRLPSTPTSTPPQTPTMALKNIDSPSQSVVPRSGSGSGLPRLGSGVSPRSPSKARLQQKERFTFNLDPFPSLNNLELFNVDPNSIQGLSNVRPKLQRLIAINSVVTLRGLLVGCLGDYSNEELEWPCLRQLRSR